MAITNDNKYYEVDEYGIPSKFKTFLTVDTQEEMESIDTTRLMQGSRVTVIGTGSIYRLSSTGEWVKFYPAGETPGPTPPEPTEHFMDLSNLMPWFVNNNSQQLTETAPLPTTGSTLRINFDENFTNVIGNTVSNSTDFTSDIQTSYQFSSGDTPTITLKESNGIAPYEPEMSSGLIAWGVQTDNVSSGPLDVECLYIGDEGVFPSYGQYYTGDPWVFYEEGLAGEYRFNVRLAPASEDTAGTVEVIRGQKVGDSELGDWVEYHIVAHFENMNTGETYDRTLADNYAIAAHESADVDISEYTSSSDWTVSLHLVLDNETVDPAICATQGITVDII